MSVTPLRSTADLQSDNDTPKKPKRDIPVVPNLMDALNDLVTAKWLRVRDDEEEGAQEQMTGESINIGLICALLLTVFAPLYYSEAARVNLPDDGFSIDVALGFLSKRKVMHLPKFMIHEIFDMGYFLSVAATVIGTFCSVYFALAANEAGADPNVLVLRKQLGNLIIVPYLCITVGIVGFCTPFWLHFIIVSRTVVTLVLKILVGISITSIFLLCMGRMVQGVSMARHEELTIPPVMYEGEQLQLQVDKFFAEADQSELSVRNLVNHLRGEPSDGGYLPPLSFVTRIKATKIFMERMSKVIGIAPEELKKLDAMYSRSRD